LTQLHLQTQSEELFGLEDSAVDFRDLFAVLMILEK
jgi:hypothetical protein